MWIGNLKSEYMCSKQESYGLKFKSNLSPRDLGKDKPVVKPKTRDPCPSSGVSR